MDGSKTKEQLLEELIRMQKDIEVKAKAQEQFIHHFKLLVQDDGLFSQVIDSLSYPVAIFYKNGVVSRANKALMTKAGIGPTDISAGKINLLDRITDENYSILEAAEDVFLGETAVVRALVSPLTLFCRDKPRAEQDAYQSAVFFPVPGSDGIQYGAVMLMQ